MSKLLDSCESLKTNISNNNETNNSSMLSAIEVTDNKNNSTNIILKSIDNTTTNIDVNIDNAIKTDLNYIFEKLNSNELTHTIKLIYSGKLLNIDNSFKSYGVKEDHVVLYILKEKESSLNQIVDNNSNENNSNISDINRQVLENINSNSNRALLMERGFGRLINQGISAREINSIRLLYHATYLTTRNNNPSSEFWSPESIISREEELFNEFENNSANNQLSLNDLRSQFYSNMRNYLVARRRSIFDTLSANTNLLVNNSEENSYLNVCLITLLSYLL